MVKDSDKIFGTLLENINDILSEETINEADGKRGRRKADYIFQGHNSEIFKMLKELANRGLYLVHGQSHKDIDGSKVEVPLPASSISTICRYLFENGFTSEHSKLLIQILGKRIQDIQDLYNQIVDATKNVEDASNGNSLDAWSKYLNGQINDTKSDSSNNSTETTSTEDLLADIDFDDDDFKA